MTERRSAAELISEDDAWPDIASQAHAARATVLPRDEQRCRNVLEALQVTTRSALGAVAYHCGGILIDHGWVRILGGGHGELTDLAAANGLEEQQQKQPPGHLLVATDGLGGSFALNGGDLAGEPGEVNYWGPDTLDWTPLGTGHSGFLDWLLSGGTTDFYRELRWEGWETMASEITPSQGIALYPPPFTAEGRDLAAVSKRAVDWFELRDFYAETARQLDDSDGPFIVPPLD